MTGAAVYPTRCKHVSPITETPAAERLSGGLCLPFLRGSAGTLRIPCPLKRGEYRRGVTPRLLPCAPRPGKKAARSFAFRPLSGIGPGNAGTPGKRDSASPSGKKPCSRPFFSMRDRDIPATGPETITFFAGLRNISGKKRISAPSSRFKIFQVLHEFFLLIYLFYLLFTLNRRTCPAFSLPCARKSFQPSTLRKRRHRLTRTTGRFCPAEWQSGSASDEKSTPLRADGNNLTYSLGPRAQNSPAQKGGRGMRRKEPGQNATLYENRCFYAAKTPFPSFFSEKKIGASYFCIMFPQEQTYYPFSQR